MTFPFSECTIKRPYRQILRKGFYKYLGISYLLLIHLNHRSKSRLIWISCFELVSTVSLLFSHWGTGSKIFSFLGQEGFFFLVLPLIYWSVDAGLGLKIAIIFALSNNLQGIFKLKFALILA